MILPRHERDPRRANESGARADEAPPAEYGLCFPVQVGPTATVASWACIGIVRSEPSVFVPGMKIESESKSRWDTCSLRISPSRTPP